QKNRASAASSSVKCSLNGGLKYFHASLIPKRVWPCLLCFVTSRHTDRIRPSVARRITRAASIDSTLRSRCASCAAADGSQLGGASITVASRANERPCLRACLQRGLRQSCPTPRAPHVSPPQSCAADRRRQFPQMIRCCDLESSRSQEG